MTVSLLEQAVIKHGPEAVYALLTPEQRADLRYNWEACARPDQLIPELLPSGLPWFVTIVLAGRGFGKTRAGSEWVRKQVRRYQFVNLIGATADDARDIMVEGESGIMAVCPKDERPIYKRSDRQLIWPNGATSLIFTADEPERLRGKQHMKVWADEVGAWRYDEAWDQMTLGLRLGDCPQALATTTPKPRKLIRDLIKDPTTYVVRGSTFDNAKNLAPAFLSKIKSKYEGTRLGRQELYAEILDDVPGALWTRTMLDDGRVAKAPDMIRVVVAVDPSGGSTSESDEQGIVVAGLGVDGHGYVLDDRSCRLSPDGWGKRAIQAYVDHQADRVCGEKNFGGDMVEFVIASAARSMNVNASYKAVNASRGKRARAEPVSALYEQGRVHHVGVFDKLEDQQCSYTPDYDGSPDRVDALVWALTELMVDSGFVDIGESPTTSGIRRGDEPAQDNDDDEPVLIRSRGGRW